MPNNNTKVIHTVFFFFFPENATKQACKFNHLYNVFSLALITPFVLSTFRWLSILTQIKHKGNVNDSTHITIRFFYIFILVKFGFQLQTMITFSQNVIIISVENGFIDANFITFRLSHQMQDKKHIV